MVSREESNGQALSANARFFPTNGVPAPLEVLLRAGVARFADPTEHRLVELIRQIDAEIVCVAVRAERFDFFDAWIVGKLSLENQADAEIRFPNSGAGEPHPHHE